MCSDILKCVLIYCHEGDFGQPGSQGAFTLKLLIRNVQLYWVTTLLYYVKLSTMRKEAGFVSLTLSLLFIPYQNVGVIFGIPLRSWLDHWIRDVLLSYSRNRTLFSNLVWYNANSSSNLLYDLYADRRLICWPKDLVVSRTTHYSLFRWSDWVMRRHLNLKYKWRPNSAGAFIFASGILILAAIILQRSDDVKL